MSFARRIGVTGTAHALARSRRAPTPRVRSWMRSGACTACSPWYVVDGSVLPRSSRVNPSLTIYAWSLRVADLLVRRLRAEVGTNSSARADG
ncbi:MAG: hypothetical protein IPJ97_18180 [Proteobacteria bacterium]|nr:hypothetical protein [Pseudomonadota bacterium]